MSTSAIIEVDALVKRFGGRPVVQGVSFKVGGGEVVGLLGPNGAGKTTTLRVLAGLLAPSRGTARVGGVDVVERPLDVRRKLGFLTASTGLYDRITGRELMEIFGRLHGIEKEALTRRVRELTDELELGAFVDRRCGVLSTGQKQRISIARAILHDPMAYVLDEPTSTLDPLASKSILELVRSARARGKAVLFSTHRMEEAEFLCDRICFLREGRIVAEGTPGSLRTASGQTSLTGVFLHYAAQPEEARA